MLFFFDPEFRDLRDRPRRVLRAGGVWSSSPLAADGSLESLKESPLLSGVVLVSPKQLAHLAAWPELAHGQREKIEAAAKGGAPFIYAVKRGPKAWLWLLVAQDAEAMGALLDALACAPAPVEGVVPAAACKR
jgi:hypothetical protein